jgi:pimeloyl-ACP methyl ester carboxylesterase
MPAKSKQHARAAPPLYRVEGEGKVLIYIPGIEGTARLLFKQIDDLCRVRRVVSVPLRPEGQYGLDRLVADVKWIAGQVTNEPVTLLAESFGGLVAIATALAHPNLVDGMILLNTFPCFAQRAKIRSAVALLSVLPYSLFKAYRTGRSRDELFSSDISSEDRKTFHELTRLVPRDGYLSRLRIIRDTDLRPQLKNVSARTLVIAGSEDRLFDSVAYGRQITASVPNAKLKILHGTGHAALLAGGVRVRDWLSEIENF